MSQQFHASQQVDAFQPADLLTVGQDFAIGGFGNGETITGTVSSVVIDNGRLIAEITISEILSPEEVTRG